MKFFVKTLLVALLATTGIVQAQEWPNRPISLIVSYPPGGTADLMARTVATPLGKILGTSVVVEQAGCERSDCSSLCCKG